MVNKCSELGLLNTKEEWRGNGCAIARVSSVVTSVDTIQHDASVVQC